MTDKQLKLIYEYMRKTGWLYDTFVFEPITPRHLDSNSAWEVVQEMERKGDWKSFYDFKLVNYFKVYSLDKTTAWLFNPDNFFRCLGEFLESRGRANENLANQNGQ